jgi:hypothetical protein
MMTDDVGDKQQVPSPLTMERKEGEGVSDVMEADVAMTARYLQYECKYRACKYPELTMTWGELFVYDYDHFRELLTHEVPLDSNTFVALRGHLKDEDVTKAFRTIRTRDTEDGKSKIRNEFLDMQCTHRGRMGGKTWREIREEDYSYFVWSVGNTMTRETKTYKVLSSCLDPHGTKLVNGSAKGQVVVQKKMKYSGIQSV